VSVGSTLRPYSIAYRRAYGSARSRPLQGNHGLCLVQLCSCLPAQPLSHVPPWDFRVSIVL